MKVSTSWIVPAGQVWLVRRGEIIVKKRLREKRLREKLDGIAFDELIVNGSNDRDTVTPRVT